MDPDALLRTFDEQVRRRPRPEPEGRAERDAHVVRVVAADAHGWNGVVWSDLDPRSADAAIAEQVRRFAQTGHPWEWKHYSYDEPADLPARLLAAGFTPEEPEALLVAEIAQLDLSAPAPAGIELRGATDAAAIDAVVGVHDEVFGEDHSSLRTLLRAALAHSPVPVTGVLALAGGVAVAAGRVEFAEGTQFASLWGGGTLPQWRRRGIFAALVAFRAGLAAARGYRYLQIDALPTSAPILRRLGFVELAQTTPYTHPGGRSLTGPAGSHDPPPITCILGPFGVVRPACTAVSSPGVRRGRNDATARESRGEPRGTRRCGGSRVDRSARGGGLGRPDPDGAAALARVLRGAADDGAVRAAARYRLLLPVPVPEGVRRRSRCTARATTAAVRRS